MKRIISLCFISILATTISFAETPNAFIPSKKDARLELQETDSKGKVQAYTINTVMNITETDEVKTIEVFCETLDAKRRPSDKVPPFTMVSLVSEDKIITLKETILPDLPLPGSNVMVVGGNDVPYPVYPEIGQAIDSYSLSFTLKDKKDKEKLVGIFECSDREITAHETITVPAGTFECYKLIETQSTKAMLGLGINGNSESWYAPEVGLVKNIRYTKNGKVDAIIELISVTENN